MEAHPCVNGWMFGSESGDEAAMDEPASEQDEEDDLQREWEQLKQQETRAVESAPSLPAPPTPPLPSLLFHSCPPSHGRLALLGYRSLVAGYCVLSWGSVHQLLPADGSLSISTTSAKHSPRHSPL